MKPKSAALAATSGGIAGPAVFTVEYIVTKRFKYHGRYLEVGETFTPAGGRYDELIIAQQKLVERRESALPSTRNSRQRARKEKANGN